jgi:Uma2 family endonuclease
MRAEIPRAILEVHYEAAAEDYLRKLKPENHMEAPPQATQREITLASLALVHERRPEVQFFNELLVQYAVGNRRKPGQVVPDNMIVVHPTPLRVPGHYSLALQPAKPFWVMEYVSSCSKRKDYGESMRKYEAELKVAYYLLFYPDNQELSLFRHDAKRGGVPCPN